jgi:hypothetical protein
MLIMFPLIGGLIGAGASLLGQSMTNSANEQINQQNIAMQEAINASNIAEQEKFAQQGIQWRVADAKAAGINPLAALGAQTASFSNQVAPSMSGPPGGAGAGVAAAGQNISRAMQAMQSPEDKAVAVESTRLRLENAQLQNDLLKKQLLGSNVATAFQPGSPPGVRAVKDDSAPVPATTVATDEGGPMSGPSRPTEGFSWSNPFEHWYYGNREIQKWMGGQPPGDLFIPGKDAIAVHGDLVAKNPVTGRYWNATDTLFNRAEDWARKPWEKLRGYVPGMF